MTTDNKVDLIFEKWKASLATKDKGWGAVSSNFDELFDELANIGTTFDEAHAILPAAIKAHQPAPGLVKSMWRTVRSQPKYAGMTEKEYADGWNGEIADKGTNSFYSAFQVPEPPDDDGEPKTHGSMSAKEYRLQRRHAESYPVLDTEELGRRIRSGAYNPAEDLLGDKEKDGDSN